MSKEAFLFVLIVGFFLALLLEPNNKNGLIHFPLPGHSHFCPEWEEPCR